METCVFPSEKKTSFLTDGVNVLVTENPIDFQIDSFIEFHSESLILPTNLIGNKRTPSQKLYDLELLANFQLDLLNNTKIYEQKIRFGTIDLKVFLEKVDLANVANFITGELFRAEQFEILSELSANELDTFLSCEHNFLTKLYHINGDLLRYLIRGNFRCLSEFYERLHSNIILVRQVFGNFIDFICRQAIDLFVQLEFDNSESFPLDIHDNSNINLENKLHHPLSVLLPPDFPVLEDILDVLLDYGKAMEVEHMCGRQEVKEKGMYTNFFQNYVLS